MATKKATDWGRAGAAVKWMRGREQNLIMNFWPPTFYHWHDGFSDADMPWEAKYDWVEVHTYDEDTKQFNLHFRDDFSMIDKLRWLVVPGGSFS